MSETYFTDLVQRRGIFTRDNYFATEAFEILGRWLFGEEWTGFEMQERPLPSPAQAESERQRLAALDDEMKDMIEQLKLRAAQELPERERFILEHDLRCAHGTRRSVAERLHELDHGEDPPAETVKTAAQRRQYVERKLYKALAAGEIQVLLRHAFYVDRSIWRGRGFPHFRFDFARSEAVVPASYSSRRRHLMLLPMNEFRTWLQKQEPLRAPPEAATNSAADACRLYLESQIRAGTRRRAKREHRAEALKNIPGLGVREFDRIWNEVVPLDWKSKGRLPLERGRRSRAEGFP